MREKIRGNFKKEKQNDQSEINLKEKSRQIKEKQEKYWEQLRNEDKYHFKLDREVSQHTRQKFSNFYAFKKIINTHPIIGLFVEEYRSKTGWGPIKKMQFSQEFKEYLKNNTLKYEKIQQKLLNLLDRINESNEIYTYVRERMKDKNLTQKALGESIFGKEDMVRSYIRNIEEDNFCRKEIRTLGRQLKNEELLKYWDDFVKQNPWHRTRVEKYRDFAKHLERNYLYEDNVEKKAFQFELLEIMNLIGPNELKNLYFYYRYNYKWKQEKIARFVYVGSGHGYFTKMGYDQADPSKISPSDFANLSKFLVMVKKMAENPIYNKRNLVLEYKHGNKSRPIYYDQVIYKSFISFVHNHEEFFGTKNKDVDRLIVWARDIEVKSVEGEDIAGIYAGKKSKVERILEKSTSSKIEFNEKLNKRIMTADQLESNIKRYAGKEKANEIKNYLEFLRTLKKDPEIQMYWWKYYDKKRPFEFRMGNFAKYLENHHLYEINNSKEILSENFEKIKKTQEMYKYVVFLHQNGKSTQEIASKLFLNDEGVRKILKKHNVGLKVSQTEIMHMEVFISLLNVDIVTDYQKNFCKDKGQNTSLYKNGKVLNRFMEFAETREEFSNSKTPKINVQQTIKILREIRKNKETEKLVEILGKQMKFYLTDISKVLLIERDTAARIFEKLLSKEEYEKRFAHELNFDNKYHDCLENLTTKFFNEHPELGLIYQEVFLYKDENHHRIDSFIIASNDLKERLFKELGIKNAKFILIDYTNNYKDEYLLEKMLKYAPKDDAALLILGINWTHDKPTIPLPKTDKFTVRNPNRIRIISPRKFARILNIPAVPENENWRIFSKVTTSNKLEEIDVEIEEVARWKDHEKNTDDLLKELVGRKEMKSGDSLTNMFGNFDLETIDGNLLTLQNGKSISADVLQSIEENKALQIEEIREQIPGEGKQLVSTLRVLEKKGKIKRTKSHNEVGRPIKLYHLPEIEPPIDPQEIKGNNIVQQYKAGVPIKLICKNLGVSPKTVREKIEALNIGIRASLFRIKAYYCYKAIQEDWDKRFLHLILNLRQFSSLKKLLDYRKDGHGYFDESDPLKQDEILEGIGMKRQSIASVIKGTDKRIIRLYYNTIKLLKQNPSANLEKFSRDFILNAEDKINKHYGFAEYWFDFKRFIIDDINKPGNFEKIWSEIIKDPELIEKLEKMDKKRQPNLDPKSDTGIIVSWIIENPEITRKEVQSKVLEEINNGTLKMKKSSMYNIVKKAFYYAEKISNEKMKKN